MLIPLVHFDRIAPSYANKCLENWGHKMGACVRPFPVQSFALWHNGAPVAIIMHGPIIAPQVATAVMGHALNRSSTVEVARLCSSSPHLNRVILRLWREFILPSLISSGVCQYAISYQDADLHTGNTYRFDGWQRIAYSMSGTDPRSGRAGRRKWIWLWPPVANIKNETEQVQAIES